MPLWRRSLPLDTRSVTPSECARVERNVKSRARHATLSVIAWLPAHSHYIVCVNRMIQHGGKVVGDIPRFSSCISVLKMSTLEIGKLCVEVGNVLFYGSVS